MPRVDAQDALATREQLLADIDSLALKALADMKGLYKSVDEEGYNKDADRPWVECSVRTRVSIEVYKQMSANRREREATTRALGAIVLQKQMDAKGWEANALDVEETSQKTRALLEASLAEPAK
jgi:hypothetical protein